MSSVPNVICVCGLNRITFDTPHGRCIQCLGLDHPYDICPQCLAVSKSTKAGRTLQLKAWRAAGHYLSQAKAIAFFKQQGQLQEIKADVSGSFSSTVDNSQVLSGNVKGPILSYGSAVSGMVESQVPLIL